MKKKRVRRAVTLIEMIVVMTLIAIITSAITYNYQASLEQGKEFKTKELYSRVETIIALKCAEEQQNMSLSDINTNLADILKASPMWIGQTSPTDGWGKAITLTEVEENGEKVFKCTSEGYKNYLAKKNAKNPPKIHLQKPAG